MPFPSSSSSSSSSNNNNNDDDDEDRDVKYDEKVGVTDNLLAFMILMWFRKC
jgi:hypothetical protein